MQFVSVHGSKIEVISVFACKLLDKMLLVRICDLQFGGKVQSIQSSEIKSLVACKQANVKITRNVRENVSAIIIIDCTNFFSQKFYETILYLYYYIFRNLERKFYPAVPASPS